MKKVGIVTLYSNGNFGNKLQNYAVQETLKKFGLAPTTIKNVGELNIKDRYFLRFIRYLIRKFFHTKVLKDDKYTDNEYNKNFDRTKKFLEFDKNIVTTKKFFNFLWVKKYNNYDYYCVGSDQIWNPQFGGLNEFDLLEFVPKDKIKFSLSASIGLDDISVEKKVFAKKYLETFDGISVREEKAKEIIESFVDKKVEVLVDPTMLLTAEDWIKLEEKPEGIKAEQRFILVYMLGETSEERKSYIEKLAKSRDCEIIYILDEHSPYYICGPAEFLWLERNADLVCTDSFHSCIFSILFETPFLVFEREDAMENMGSRLETLLKTFRLTERKYLSVESEDLFYCNFQHCNKILNDERNRATKFLSSVIVEK